MTTLITTAKETNVPPRIIHRSVVTETFEEYMLLKSKRTKFSNNLEDFTRPAALVIKKTHTFKAKVYTS